MTSIDIEKLFDEYLDIKTTNEAKYSIQKKDIYINDSSSFYGQRYIVTSDKLNNKNLYVLKEIYSFEDNRLRYSCERYTNVKIVNTIEKTPDNTEKPILVVEKYDDKQILINSIGNIKRIDSDKLDEMNEKRKQKKDGILRLILKPIEERKHKEENLLAA